MNGGIAGVGERLRNAREAKGWSRAELARKTGVGEKTITKAEGRASAPEANTLLILAKALDQDPWFLTFGASTLPKSEASADDLAEKISGLANTVEVLRQELLATDERQRESVKHVQSRLQALEESASVNKTARRRAG